jgi:di/tricarboxylate transporter
VQLLRICSASAFISAFLNNTPIVAMLTPPLTLWSDDQREPPSKYLTNIIASGLAQAAGEPAFGMVEIARLGIPVALVGVLVLVATTPWALPVRRAAREAITEPARDFFVTMQVIPGGPLDGKTVAQAGLRSLEGVFLIEVDHGTTRTVPVGPATVLTGGDDLTFVGKADNHSTRGLAPVDYSITGAFDPREHPFFEAVVGPDSPLVGRALKDIGFRTRAILTERLFG